MSILEQQAGMTDLVPCNDECGGDMVNYTWMQNDNEVVIRVPVPEGTRGKDVAVTIAPKQISVGLKGAAVPPILQGELYSGVKLEECIWNIEEKKLLVVNLTKTNLKHEEWWPHVVTSDPQIDFKMLKPPSKNLRDMDEGAQATVHKMMFDQEQKRKGLPSSEELTMRDAMSKGGPPK